MDPQVMKNSSFMTDNMMKTAVTEFQMFVGLEPTGKHSCSFSVHRPCWLTKTCWYLPWSIWILCRTLAILSHVSCSMQGSLATLSLCMLAGKVNSILCMYKSRKWQPCAVVSTVVSTSVRKSSFWRHHWVHMVFYQFRVIVSLQNYLSFSDWLLLMEFVFRNLSLLMTIFWTCDRVKIFGNCTNKLKLLAWTRAE